MVSSQAAPVGRFPMRFLTAAVILTGLALAWFARGTYQLYQDARTARQRDFEIAEWRSTIIHLGELLTMSAHMAAATGDPRWEQRYRDNKEYLQAAVDKPPSPALEAFESELAAQIKTVDKLVFCLRPIIRKLGPAK